MDLRGIRYHGVHPREQGRFAKMSDGIEKSFLKIGMYRVIDSGEAGSMSSGNYFSRRKIAFTYLYIGRSLQQQVGIEVLYHVNYCRIQRSLPHKKEILKH